MCTIFENDLPPLVHYHHSFSLFMKKINRIAFCGGGLETPVNSSVCYHSVLQHLPSVAPGAVSVTNDCKWLWIRVSAVNVNLI